MRVRIHRGAHEIRANCIEIESGGSRSAQGGGERPRCRGGGEGGDGQPKAHVGDTEAQLFGLGVRPARARKLP
jgi:hypothetical protein